MELEKSLKRLGQEVQNSEDNFERIHRELDFTPFGYLYAGIVITLILAAFGVCMIFGAPYVSSLQTIIGGSFIVIVMIAMLMVFIFNLITAKRLKKKLPKLNYFKRLKRYEYENIKYQIMKKRMNYILRKLRKSRKQYMVHDWLAISNCIRSKQAAKDAKFNYNVVRLNTGKKRKGYKLR